VDSAVACHLLLRAGHAVEGVHMRTWHGKDGLGDCPWRDDLESARSVAEFCKIPFRVVSLVDRYRQFVVEPFLRSYAAGETPNPDMLCNRWIKFGALLELARELGCDGLATGHYCRTAAGEDGVHLLVGRDGTKDQSYFLAQVRREALPFLHFPLGNWKKMAVRRLARQIGLPNADRPDSQGVCFLGGKVAAIGEFLLCHLGENPGDIVDRGGRRLGRHRGIFLHTIGQRKGLAIPSNRDGEHYVAVAKDLAGNRLTVALESSSDPALRVGAVALHSLNFLCRPLAGSHALAARVRYRDPPVAAWLHMDGDGGPWVEFARPQRALAPGQHLAFYRGERLLGGGIYGEILQKSHFSLGMAPPNAQTDPMGIQEEKPRPVGCCCGKGPVQGATELPIRICVQCDVGFGNHLTIRGNGCGLCWCKGLPLCNRGADCWCWGADKPLCGEYKLLINDEVWELGENHRFCPGTVQKICPQFP
jgi:tRNA-specific 2-thiouridylase